MRHCHFIFVLDLSPSAFSVARDGDYVVYDALIASLFSILKKLFEKGKDSSQDIRISVAAFSTVHTPNARQAFLLCSPLTEAIIQSLLEKLTNFLKLLVQKYEPIAKNWLIGDVCKLFEIT